MSIVYAYTLRQTCCRFCRRLLCNNCNSCHHCGGGGPYDRRR